MPTVAAAPGKPDPANAAAVIEAIARAVGDVRAGLASRVVTNPIAKKTLYDAGFRHPGHTEFLGTLAAAWTGTPVRPVMMLAGPSLRVVPVTIHIPVRDIATTLTIDLIVETGRIVAGDLSDPVRHRRAAPGGRGAEPARGRAWLDRRRGRACRASGRRRA